MTCSLLEGMTLPSPRVTSSTWARLDQMRNRKNATADATMIIRAPVSGCRCRMAGPTNGRVAMVRLLQNLLAARGHWRRRGRGARQLGGRRRLVLLRRDQPGRRGFAVLRPGNVKGPALRRVEQSADIVGRLVQN